MVNVVQQRTIAENLMVRAILPLDFVFFSVVLWFCGANKIKIHTDYG